MQKNVLRKMWLDGRLGHANYLMFSLQFINFILIVYNFLIEDNEIFPFELWVFAIIFIICYLPISILIGRWHTNTQMRVESTIKMLEDPKFAKMVKGLLNVHTAVSTKEEIKEFRSFLTEIEKNDIKEF